MAGKPGRGGQPGRSGRKPRLVCACGVMLTGDAVARDYRGYRLGQCHGCQRKQGTRERAETRRRALTTPDQRLRRCVCGHGAIDHHRGTQTRGACTGYPDVLGACPCVGYQRASITEPPAPRA